MKNVIHHKVSFIIERLHSKIEFSFCDTRPSKYVFLHSHARNTQRQVLLCVTQTNLKKKVISLQNLQALHLQAGRFRITSWYVYTWASTFALYETLYMVFATSRFCTLFDKLLVVALLIKKGRSVWNKNAFLYSY